MKLCTRAVPSLLALACAISAAQARAAEIGLSEPGETVQGAQFQVRVGGVGFDAVDGGDFRVSWSSSLGFVAIAIDDPPWDLSSWDDSTALLGYLEYVDVFASLETPGQEGEPFGIATLTFTALEPGEAWISLEPGLVGWSLLGQTLEDVGYSGTEFEIAAALEPALAPLSAAVLGLAAFLRRRRAG